MDVLNRQDNLPRIELLRLFGAEIGLDVEVVMWLLDDTHYQQRLRGGLRYWGARNRSPLQALLCTLGETDMDPAAALEFTRACLLIRKGLIARDAG